MDGILNINKPTGKTSYDIVALVKRLTAVRRVGHAGTLDPTATGVLPVCLGQGTRIIEFLADANKTYRAEIELGLVTDTYDTAGKIIERKDTSRVTLGQIQSALANFQGTIQQTPPMYSAIKHQGKPLYELARQGVTIERKSRPARIDKINLIDWQPPIATIEVICGKGTYIRSLAYDLGETLGCGGTLRNLIRLSYGPFGIKDAISVSQFEEACRAGYWQHFIYPIDSVLLHWNAMIVGEATEKRILNGAPITPQSEKTTENSLRSRVYALDGYFLAVIRFEAETGSWQTEKAFTSSGLTP